MGQTSTRVLFLDIAGVLLTNGWGRHARRRASDHLGLDHDEMDERHHQTFDTYEQGRIALATYLRRVVFHRPQDFTEHDFKEFLYSQSQPKRDMIDFCGQLADQPSPRVGAISNEGRELPQYRVRKFSLDKLIEFFICSCFVHFRKPDEGMYRMALDVSQAEPCQTAAAAPQPKRLVVRIRREEGVEQHFRAKLPGEMMRLAPVSMRFTYRESFDTVPPGAYETLLLDVMLGDTTQFMRADRVEYSWQALSPILEAWETAPLRFPNSAAGTWGAEAASVIIAQDGRSWIDPRAGDRANDCR